MSFSPFLRFGEMISAVMTDWIKPIHLRGKIGHATVAILTMTVDEFDGVRAVFDLNEELIATAYAVKEVNQRNEYPIVIRRASGQTNVLSTQPTRDILEDFRPSYLLVIGTAGGHSGREGIKLGDIVVADFIDYSGYWKLKNGAYYMRRKALLQIVGDRVRMADGSGPVMSEFKWRHFEGEIILWAVRWYCRYGISYRDLEQMMGERGVPVDHSTIYRWVQKYAPEIEKRLRWQWRRPQSTSWRVDETYVKVRGKWTYLYRALDKIGNTIDFYLSPTRNAKAAKRFLGKALNGLKAWEKPEVINTDKAPTYGIAISELKAEGKCPEKTVHRQVKYLNNIVEADHGKLKQLIRPVRGFKTLKTAYATIMGFEVMRALRKGQAAIFNLTQDIHGEARNVERAFGIGASVLAEAATLIGERLELQPA